MGLLTLLLVLGCGIDKSDVSALGAFTIKGTVSAGQQPIADSVLQMYSVDEAGDPSSLNPTLSNSVKTDHNGAFVLPAVRSCPSANSLVYIVARGGSSKLSSGANNPALALMVALGACKDLDASTPVAINEVTTVGSIWPLAPYVKSPAQIVPANGDASQFNATVETVRDFIDVHAGVVQGSTLDSAEASPVEMLNTLANLVSACAASGGGKAGDGSVCGQLFTLADPDAVNVPNDTLAASTAIARNPTRNVKQLFDLSYHGLSFQPALVSAPANFVLPSPLQVFPPIIAPLTGTYIYGHAISITPSTAGSTVHYTTDGSTPTATSKTYTGPLTLTQSEIVRAVAIKNAMSSLAATVTYKVAAPVSISVFPTTATVTHSQTQAFTYSVSGAANTSAAWTLSPALGSISTNGVYTAPPQISAAQTVTVTATSLADPTKKAVASISLAPDVVANLSFVSQPTNVTAQAVLNPAPVVRIVDNSGKLLTTSNIAVTLSLQGAAPGAALTGTTTISAVQGVATFNNIAIDTPGTAYVLQAKSAMAVTTTLPFTVDAALPAEQAKQADSFIDAVGVATHISYTDTPYYQAWDKVFDKLKALGVRHIRDGFYDWPASSSFVTAHQQLAAAGIKCTCVAPMDSKTTIQTILNFATVAKDVEALEGPNECDADGNCGGGYSTGINNALHFLPTIAAAGRTLGIPVLGPTFVFPESYAAAGDLSSQISVNNLHVYFGGRNPGSIGWGDFDKQGNSYGSFGFWMDQGQQYGPGLPSQITETGYMAYSSTQTPYTIPESVEASYIPRTLLLAFSHGVQRTFLYELLDEFTTTGYGLLRNDLSEKPAFTALKNLIALLSDKGASFTPGKLNYTITGTDKTMNHVLFQKRDGSFWIVAWLEQTSYDPASNTQITVAAQNATISLGGSAAFKQIVKFDTSGATVTTPTTSANSVLTVPISDQLSIIQVVPK